MQFLQSQNKLEPETGDERARRDGKEKRTKACEPENCRAINIECMSAEACNCVRVSTLCPEDIFTTSNSTIPCCEDYWIFCLPSEELIKCVFLLFCSAAYLLAMPKYLSLHTVSSPHKNAAQNRLFFSVFSPVSPPRPCLCVAWLCCYMCMMTLHGYERPSRAQQSSTVDVLFGISYICVTGLFSYSFQCTANISCSTWTQ